MNRTIVGVITGEVCFIVIVCFFIYHLWVTRPFRNGRNTSHIVRLLPVRRGRKIRVKYSSESLVELRPKASVSRSEVIAERIDPFIFPDLIPATEEQSIKAAIEQNEHKTYDAWVLSIFSLELKGDTEIRFR